MKLLLKNIKDIIWLAVTLISEGEVSELIFSTQDGRSTEPCVHLKDAFVTTPEIKNIQNRN